MSGQRTAGNVASLGVDRLDSAIMQNLRSQVAFTERCLNDEDLTRVLNDQDFVDEITWSLGKPVPLMLNNADYIKLFYHKLHR